MMKKCGDNSSQCSDDKGQNEDQVLGGWWHHEGAGLYDLEQGQWCGGHPGPLSQQYLCPSNPHSGRKQSQNQNHQ